MSSDKKHEGIKVIGAGWGRTGTTSFKKAMEILGFGPCYHMTEVFANGHIRFWNRVLDGEPYDFDEIFLGKYSSSCDLPSCYYWKEQLTKYPNAKVILTTRDPESWYKSVVDTIYRFQPNSPYITLGTTITQLCGFPTPGFRSMLVKIIDHNSYNYDYSKENVINHFKKRNQSIIDECPKDKLLVFEANNGWEPLCKFLNVPIPDIPYPHENDTAQMQKIAFFINITGYVILTIGIGSVLGIGYFIFKTFGGSIGKEL